METKLSNSSARVVEEGLRRMAFLEDEVKRLNGLLEASEKDRRFLEIDLKATKDALVKADVRTADATERETGAVGYSIRMETSSEAFVLELESLAKRAREWRGKAVPLPEKTPEMQTSDLSQEHGQPQEHIEEGSQRPMPRFLVHPGHKDYAGPRSSDVG